MTSMSVCLSVFASLCTELHVQPSLNFCARYLRPWLGPRAALRCDTLCTVGFKDNVVFPSHGRMSIRYGCSE